MKNIILSIFLSMLATGAYADDYWSGFMDINTSFQRDNHYAKDTRFLENNQWSRTATVETQYRWNACAVGARVNLSAASNEITDVASGVESDRDPNAYGIGAQAGCNLSGLWLLGFGGIQKTDWGSTPYFAVIEDYRERTFGAGLYFQHMERLGYGIAVSRLNTQYTALWGASFPFEYDIDTNIVEGKVDFFITPNLLSSTTISYLDNDGSNTGSLFTRLEFKPETMNFAAYAGVGASLSNADDTDGEIKSYTAKVGLRWYFANDSLQAMHNNQMPTFE